MSNLLNLIRELLASVGSIRCVTRMESLSGTVMPPTFPSTPKGEKPVPLWFRQPVQGGGAIDCVELNSVPAEANMLEYALFGAADQGLFPLPIWRFQVGDVMQTQWHRSHRACDAALRRCSLNGVDWCDTDFGQAVLRGDVARIFQHSPNSLLCGMFFSNRLGENGLKIARTYLSEIIGVNAIPRPVHSSKGDDLPFSTQSTLSPLPFENESTKSKQCKPSTLLLGQTPCTSIDNRAARIEYAEQVTSITMVQPGHCDYQLPEAAHVAMVAMGIAGHALAYYRGCNLRSGCFLVPRPRSPWIAQGGDQDLQEVIHPLSRDEAIQLMVDVDAYLHDAGIPWVTGAEMVPSADMVRCVEDSQRQIGAKKSASDDDVQPAGGDDDQPVSGNGKRKPRRKAQTGGAR
jgi:hypothetical protein